MNRTQYMLARLEWKRDYIDAQQRIRAAKAAIREAHRALGLCGSYSYGSTADDREHNKRWRAAHDQLMNAIRELYESRTSMEDHLKALQALKELARQAWANREVAWADREAAMT